MTVDSDLIQKASSQPLTLYLNTEGDERPFWASAGSKWEWPSAESSTGEELVFEVAFVDDVAARLAAATASLLLRMFPILIEELCHVLMALGFRINWAQGKTEAFVSLRGKRSHI